MNTPTPREEFEEWLETFYDNSNILSPRSLAWEAWQAAQKEVTEQRDRLAENLERALNATVLNHRRDRWHIDAEHALQLTKNLTNPNEL